MYVHNVKDIYFLHFVDVRIVRRLIAYSILNNVVKRKDF